MQCVAADDTYVYGGTSIHGGRGCVDVTTEGKLFLFDPQVKERVFECIPVRDAIAITSLAVAGGTRKTFGCTCTRTGTLCASEAVRGHLGGSGRG